MDQHILKENKMEQENVAMGWIDKTKVYYMALQSRIIHGIKIYMVSNEVMNFNSEIMRKRINKWKTLAEVIIHKAIFQRISPTPLMF